MNTMDEKRTLNGYAPSNGLDNTVSSDINLAYGDLKDPAVVEHPAVQDVHEAVLAPWRASMRRVLVKAVERESVVIAWMQAKVRTPMLDSYFVYTSTLGTHTFFMTFLPVYYFFGNPEIGQGLLFVLALGVYLSSFLKDLICAPRPFAPPVTRLTIGTHHLEYGFPSTHSTNSVSLALLIWSRLPYPSPFYTPACIGLVFYVFSIVYGRLYTAMHSFTDCAMGVVLGTAIWALYEVVGDGLMHWVDNGGWEVPAIILPLCILMVNQHPQPVDDCPCFEDAIAFVSVEMGNLLGRWHLVRYFFDLHATRTPMPGAAWESWMDVGMWSAFAAAKMTLGIFIIFAWRIIAKSTFHLVLPPIFRLLAQAFTLPNRRFYTPATQYKRMPSALGLRPIPSVIDLPSDLALGAETDADVDFDVGRASGRRGRKGLLPAGTNELVARGAGATRVVTPDGEKTVRWYVGEADELPVYDEDVPPQEVKHYDAAVITKVIVYSGIATLATVWIPVLFEFLGWGTKRGV